MSKDKQDNTVVSFRLSAQHRERLSKLAERETARLQALGAGPNYEKSQVDIVKDLIDKAWATTEEPASTATQPYQELTQRLQEAVKQAVAAHHAVGRQVPVVTHPGGPVEWVGPPGAIGYPEVAEAAAQHIKEMIAPTWNDICGFCKGYPDQDPDPKCPNCTGDELSAGSGLITNQVLPAHRGAEVKLGSSPANQDEAADFDFLKDVE